MININNHLFKKIQLVAFDFDGVFTDNFVYVDENGKESLRFSRFDGFGLSALKENGILAIIISTEINNTVVQRAKKLKIHCFNNVLNKTAVLIEYCKERSIDLKDVVFVGNDINDSKTLEVVGHPVVVCDAHPSLNAPNYIQTNIQGGKGVVREICDKIIEDLKNE